MNRHEFMDTAGAVWFLGGFWICLTFMALAAYYNW